VRGIKPDAVPYSPLYPFPIEGQVSLLPRTSVRFGFVIGTERPCAWLHKHDQASEIQMALGTLINKRGGPLGEGWTPGRGVFRGDRQRKSDRVTDDIQAKRSGTGGQCCVVIALHDILMHDAAVRSHYYHPRGDLLTERPAFRIDGRLPQSEQTWNRKGRDVMILT